MHWKAWGSALPCCSWLTGLTICHCCFCLNELFLVLQEISVQRTLINSILFILCFCFVLHCSSFECLFCKCTTFFLTLDGVWDQNVFHSFSLPYDSCWKFRQTAGVDTSCFWHQYTDFGYKNMGVPKFNLK